MGKRTGVETRGRPQDGDGSGDGNENSSGDGNGEEDGNRNGDEDRIGDGGLLLALYWEITMDKSQGQAIKKAAIYLGKSEATARLAFGCISRAKRLVDLLVDPMPSDRLSKLGDKSALKIRLGSAL